MIVVDASAIAEVLLETPVAAAIMDRIYAEGEQLVAPHVIDLEIVSVVRRTLFMQEVEPELAEAMIVIYQQMAITRFPHDVLLRRIWMLRHNVTSYDAAYVALAEALGVPLITRDLRLARSSGHSAKIEYVE